MKTCTFWIEQLPSIGNHTFVSVNFFLIQLSFNSLGEEYESDYEMFVKISCYKTPCNKVKNKKITQMSQHFQNLIEKS